MTRRNVRKQGWVFPLFSPNSDDRLSLNFHMFVILYIKCDTRSVGLGQYCLPKVSNSFNGQTLYHIISIDEWIIDPNNLNVCLLKSSSQHQATNPAKSVSKGNQQILQSCKSWLKNIYLDLLTSQLHHLSFIYNGLLLPCSVAKR